MFRTDARIIEARGNRMRLVDLSVLVHKEISAVAVQHPRAAAGDRGGMHAGVKPMTRGLDAINFNVIVVEEWVEQAHRVRAAADTGDERIRQAALCRLHLLARLAADDRLKIPHPQRTAMR